MNAIKINAAITNTFLFSTYPKLIYTRTEFQRIYLFYNYNYLFFYNVLLLFDKKILYKQM